ncbi:TPA_exp: Uncharacterized protein A8136_0733 [Trichophyton benhamiae CBS 112371]|uniref:BTB domain-containing protein n=1 Tax=Arthroderma benhamiae (strain ATCC MYA-4681 / CBS 112371) TaxID=663331 RepID=D4AUB3_ARTBC|nr:uncharacterized protein ARB_07743 [Trichophyton benhamiae CBS 112371]EFE33383.1 hypothetical protein ARB_07743 [Trichophyton benhamiae CBS 112371]DAA76419.1 TPA_exp: Uncharacterized protein A8136_0733 [Trichophyton benhamiae CBS 112371]
MMDLVEPENTAFFRNLGTHSTFFSRMLEHDWKETLEGVVELKDDDPQAIKAMLSFMYKFDYTNPAASAASFIFDAQVFAVAEKYDVEGLKFCVKDKFHASILSDWKDDDYPDVIRGVYDIPTTDPALRDTLVQVTCANINNLIQKDEFKSALNDVPGFAVQLITRLVDNNSTVARNLMGL